MSKIGGIVLKRACAEAAGWPQHLRVAVNVSAAQFKDEALELDVMAALAASGLSPQRLELEITETVLLDCSDDTLAMLRRLRNIGIRLAMDDFGTGYSSFGYLRHMPFSSIKIDRSFIQNVVTEKNTQAIVQSIVKLAKSLGMSTTAEGIETEEQLLCVKDSGCREVQGYLFSKPIPPSEIRRYADQFEQQERESAVAA
jgi:EAL domain-containing protein (putative c-di-GMP-specific phosphodiesterase class I)